MGSLKARYLKHNGGQAEAAIPRLSTYAKVNCRRR